jgi:hypothetical protein
MHSHRLSPLEAARLIGDTSIDAARVDGGRGTGNNPADSNPQRERGKHFVLDADGGTVEVPTILRNAPGVCT